jgi:hypothetical protein
LPGMQCTHRRAVPAQQRSTSICWKMPGGS